MTRRTYMWTRIYGRYGDLSEPGNFERCLAAILALKDARTLKPDPERLRREFWQGVPSYGRLFALLHEHFAERVGKPRWGEQEGHIEEYADDIFAAYPDAKVIHLIRDPRNRYEEMLVTTPPTVRIGRVGVNTKDWLQSVQLARRNQGRYPEGYKILHYEELLSDPVRTLRDVCSFIGEDYDAAMITLEHAIRFGEQQEAEPVSEWDTGVVEFTLEGSRAVSRREVAFMQAVAGQEMKAWGYTPRPVKLSPLETLLYCAVDWPFGVVRMAAEETLSRVS